MIFLQNNSRSGNWRTDRGLVDKWQ